MAYDGDSDLSGQTDEFGELGSDAPAEEQGEGRRNSRTEERFGKLTGILKTKDAQLVELQTRLQMLEAQQNQVKASVGPQSVKDLDDDKLGDLIQRVSTADTPERQQLLREAIFEAIDRKVDRASSQAHEGLAARDAAVARQQAVSSEILSEFGPDTQNHNSPLAKAAAAEFDKIAKDFEADGISRDKIPLSMHKRAWKYAAIAARTGGRPVNEYLDELERARDRGSLRGSLSGSGVPAQRGRESGARLKQIIDSGDSDAAIRAISDSMLEHR